MAGVIQHYTKTDFAGEGTLLLAVMMEEDEGKGGGQERKSRKKGLAMGEDEWEGLCRERGGWEFINGRVGKEWEGEGERMEKEGKNEFGGALIFLIESILLEYETVGLSEDEKAGGQLYQREREAKKRYEKSTS